MGRHWDNPDATKSIISQMYSIDAKLLRGSQSPNDKSTPGIDDRSQKSRNLGDIYPGSVKMPKGIVLQYLHA